MKVKELTKEKENMFHQINEFYDSRPPERPKTAKVTEPRKSEPIPMGDPDDLCVFESKEELKEPGLVKESSITGCF